MGGQSISLRHFCVGDPADPLNGLHRSVAASGAAVVFRLVSPIAGSLPGVARAGHGLNERPSGSCAREATRSGANQAAPGKTSVRLDFHESRRNHPLMHGANGG